jgi:outer membrane protein assembly factor BamD (BamD/ComL family)
MKNKSAFFRVFASRALGLAILAGCSSGPPVIPEDLSVLQLFQRAQEETDYNEWENALVYYRTFIERHPEDLPNVTAARYEIAYINYKQENYAEAAKGFQELLDFYEKTNNLPLSFPLWPRVLSQKVMQTMKDKGVLPPEQPAGPTEAG